MMERVERERGEGGEEKEREGRERERGREFVPRADSRRAIVFTDH